MTTATVTVTAKTWEESHVAEAEAPHAVARAAFTTEWSGDIAATTTCNLLIAYTGGDPDQPQTLVGPYAGYDLVDATIDGRRGTFVLAARGEHSGAVADTQVEVVAGSGTGELHGISGSGHYRADGMSYSLTLDYQLP